MSFCRGRGLVFYDCLISKRYDHGHLHFSVNNFLIRQCGCPGCLTAFAFLLLMMMYDSWDWILDLNELLIPYLSCL